MLVVRLRGHRLVALEPLAELMGPHQPALHQQIQGAIHRRRADSLSLLLQLAADGLNREVVFGQEHDLGYQVSLAGNRLVVLAKVTAKALEKGRSFGLIEVCHRRGTARPGPRGVDRQRRMIVVGSALGLLQTRVRASRARSHFLNRRLELAAFLALTAST